MTLAIYFYLLLVKHAIADLWLQSRLNQTKYGDKLKLTSPKLWLHSLDHAVLTAVITLLFAGLWWAIVIAVLDFVLHSLIDYVKRVYTVRKNITTKQNLFWKIQAIDQLAHFSCYFIYVLIIL